MMSKTFRRPLVALIALQLMSASCAGDQMAQDDETAVTAEGRIVVVGTEADSWTFLAREGSAPLYILGEFEPELKRLTGAEIRVTGYPNVAAPGKALNVQSYEILSIDGGRPLVGVLEVRAGKPWLRVEGGEFVELIGLDDGAISAGTKMWAVGELSESRILVQSYGVIRQ